MNNEICYVCGGSRLERKEVRETCVIYTFICVDCYEKTILEERRCNCGSEEPAINCPEGTIYCG